MSIKNVFNQQAKKTFDNFQKFSYLKLKYLLPILHSPVWPPQIMDATYYMGYIVLKKGAIIVLIVFSGWNQVFSIMMTISMISMIYVSLFSDYRLL